jgi:hypothetical protein
VVSGGFATALGLLVPLVSLVAGGFIFDRTASGTDFEGDWKDVFSPRNGAFKALGVFVLFCISSGVAWICVQADGWVGVAESLLLIGFLFAMSWAGSYVDLVLRGVSYWTTTIWQALVLLLRSAVRFLHLLALAVAAFVAAAVLLALQIAAFPFTLIRSWFQPAARAEAQVA